MFWGSKRFHNSVRLLLIAPWWWCHYNLVTLISLWLVDLWGLRPDGVHSRLHLHRTRRCHLGYVSSTVLQLYLYISNVLASQTRGSAALLWQIKQTWFVKHLIQISGAQRQNGTNFDCKSEFKNLSIFSLMSSLNLELDLDCLSAKRFKVTIFGIFYFYLFWSNRLMNNENNISCNKII